MLQTMERAPLSSPTGLVWGTVVGQRLANLLRLVPHDANERARVLLESALAAIERVAANAAAARETASVFVEQAEAGANEGVLASVHEETAALYHAIDRAARHKVNAFEMDAVAIEELLECLSFTVPRAVAAIDAGDAAVVLEATSALELLLPQLMSLGGLSEPDALRVTSTPCSTGFLKCRLEAPRTPPPSRFSLEATPSGEDAAEELSLRIADVGASDDMSCGEHDLSVGLAHMTTRLCTVAEQWSMPLAGESGGAVCVTVPTTVTVRARGLTIAASFPRPAHGAGEGAVSLLAALMAASTSLAVRGRTLLSVVELLRLARARFPALQRLRVRGVEGGLGGADASAFSDALFSMHGLQEIDLSWVSIDPAGARALSTALAALPDLRLLDLSHCIDDDESASVVADALRSTPQLRTLRLQGGKFGPVGACTLATALNSLRLLEVLRLSDSAAFLTSYALASAVQTMVQLRELDISTFQPKLPRLPFHMTYFRGVLRGLTLLEELSVAGVFPGNTIAALAEVLGTMTRLRVLDARSNFLDGSSVRCLTDALGALPELRKLNLAANNLSAAGVVRVAAALAALPLLEELDLSGCGMGKEGARALAPALGACPRLEVLEVGGNEIGDASVLGLDKLPLLRRLGLARNTCSGPLSALPRLEHLDVSSNSIGEAGAHYLAGALSGFPQLRRLLLNDNELGARGARYVAAALCSVPLLEELGLDANVIGGAGARDLAKRLGDTPRLEVLQLSENCINDAGACALAEAFRALPRLRKVSLHRNYVGATGARALAEAWESAPRLGELSGVAGTAMWQERLASSRPGSGRS